MQLVTIQEKINNWESSELPILEELSKYLSIPQSETTKITHSIHPYPAKFIPQIPKRIIEEFSNERHTILDPFCGSGTTLLEAKILGRNSIGFDINPIGVLTSRVKTEPLVPEDIDIIKNVVKEINNKLDNKDFEEAWVPDIPRIDHWFKKDVQKALGAIISEIRKVENLRIRRFLNLCVSSILVSVSNQESDTRFAAITKKTSAKKVKEAFNTKIKQLTEKLNELSSLEFKNNTKTKVFLADTRKMSKYIKERSADLVITSPPYLNSYDYYLYHKFRTFWLNYPENNKEMLAVKDVQENEIGSRYKFSGQNGNDIISFKKNMIECLKEIRKVTKPGKMIFFLVGDSIVRGKFIKMDLFYKELGEEAGLEYVSSISYDMAKISRSFVSQNVNNKWKKKQHIIVFKNTSISKRVQKEFKFEASQEVKEIPMDINDGARIIITSNDVAKYTHKLIKYPSKFIPHIPRWAIKTYTKKDDIILDPFVGSGTSLVESQLLGRKSVGIDINPFAVLSSNVKSNPISQNILKKKLEGIIKDYKRYKSADVLKFDLMDFWFDQKILFNISKIKRAIYEIDDKQIQDFFILVLSNIIKPCSFLDEAQIKVKRDHNKLINGVPEPIKLFKDKAQSAIFSMGQFDKAVKSPKTSIAIAGDSTSIPKKVTRYGDELLINNVDLVITSPPYINAINYPMFNRYELMLLDLVSPDNYINHQQEYIGTERVYAKDYKCFKKFNCKNNQFDDLNEKLEKIYQQEPKRAYIAGRYFENMEKSFEQINHILKQDGKCVTVLGSNTIREVYLPTWEILNSIAKNCGFEIVKKFEYQIRNHRFKITRHPTGKKINIDNITVLKKVN